MSKVKELEELIIKFGHTPKEVRLQHNRVKFFLCQGEEGQLTVFDGSGHCWELDEECPEDTSSISLHWEANVPGDETLYANGKRMRRRHVERWN